MKCKNVFTLTRFDLIAGIWIFCCTSKYKTLHVTWFPLKQTCGGKIAICVKKPAINFQVTSVIIKPGMLSSYPFVALCIPYILRLRAPTSCASQKRLEPRKIFKFYYVHVHTIPELPYFKWRITTLWTVCFQIRYWVKKGATLVRYITTATQCWDQNNLALSKRSATQQTFEDDVLHKPKIRMPQNIGAPTYLGSP